MTANQTNKTADVIQNHADTLEELRAIREVELEYMEETGTLPEDMNEEGGAL